MNLEEQVVSLETAKKLKEAGWEGYNNKTLFWWSGMELEQFEDVFDENGKFFEEDWEYTFPAPTISELLFELSAFIEKSIFCLEFQKWTSYMEENEKGETIAFDGITLQESLATMWLYLKQNNLLKEGV